MIFNGITKDYIAVLKGRDRPAWANRVHEINERHRVTKSSTESKIITVPVMIKHDGFRDLQRKKEDLAEWLVHDEVKKLEFMDDPNRYYMALVDGAMGIEEEVYWGEGEIEFICPVPYKFGSDRIINLTSQHQEFNITGQIDTPWMSRTVFSEPANRFQIEGSNGLNIILNFDFIEGHVLEVNFEKRSVTLNGNDLAVAIDLRTEWKELPGGHSVVLSATHPTDIKYTERYY